MKYIEDNIYGIDFEFEGITFDQKFSFGDLGKNIIKIRVQNRKLLNKSDFTLCIDELGEIEIFSTNKLAEFVKKNWGIISKNRLEQKKDYVSYKINLFDFYRIENVICIKTQMTKGDFKYALSEIINNNYIEKYEKNYKIEKINEFEIRKNITDISQMFKNLNN